MRNVRDTRRRILTFCRREVLRARFVTRQSSSPPPPALDRLYRISKRFPSPLAGGLFSVDARFYRMILSTGGVSAMFPNISDRSDKLSDSSRAVPHPDSFRWQFEIRLGESSVFINVLQPRVHENKNLGTRIT